VSFSSWFVKGGAAPRAAFMDPAASSSDTQWDANRERFRVGKLATERPPLELMPSCAKLRAQLVPLQPGSQWVASHFYQRAALPGPGAPPARVVVDRAHPALNTGQLGLSGWCGLRCPAASVEQAPRLLRSGAPWCAAMNPDLGRTRRDGLNLILGDRLHRECSALSALQLAAGSRVLMIRRPRVASAYRYHKLRLLHTFVAMRQLRDALVEQGGGALFRAGRFLCCAFWQRLRSELGDGDTLQGAEIADRRFEATLQQVLPGHGVQLSVLPRRFPRIDCREAPRPVRSRRPPLVSPSTNGSAKPPGAAAGSRRAHPAAAAGAFDTENRRRFRRAMTSHPCCPLGQWP